MNESKPTQPKSAKTPRLTGHEAYIENLRADGAEVKLHLMNGASTTGIVRAADKYTISLKLADGSTDLVFKHGIAKLTPTKRGAKKND